MNGTAYEMKAEFMKDETSKIPLSEYFGKWRFGGYYPHNCKDEP